MEGASAVPGEATELRASLSNGNGLSQGREKGVLLVLPKARGVVTFSRVSRELDSVQTLWFRPQTTNTHFTRSQTGSGSTHFTAGETGSGTRLQAAWWEEVEGQRLGWSRL